MGLATPCLVFPFPLGPLSERAIPALTEFLAVSSNTLSCGIAFFLGEPEKSTPQQLSPLFPFSLTLFYALSKQATEFWESLHLFKSDQALWVSVWWRGSVNAWVPASHIRGLGSKT